MNATVANLDMRAPTFGAADCLCLAATPAFAIMALLTGVAGDGRLNAICSFAHGDSPLGGMVPMYLLMSAFHSAPWLKLISSRKRHPGQTKSNSTVGNEPAPVKQR